MKKIICPGEALIDFVSFDLGKSLKETSSFIKKAGGAPANVAAAISKLGVKAYFAGTVGDDAFGKFLEDTFDNNNINTELMFKLNKHNTTFAFVSLMEDGERDFEFARDADSCLTYDMIEEKLNEFDLFHFGSATAFLGGELKTTYYKLKEYNDFKLDYEFIDKIKDGNTITMPVETTRAGEYEFDFSYKTAVPMTLKISGEGIEDTEVVLEASEELTNIDKLS